MDAKIVNTRYGRKIEISGSNVSVYGGLDRHYASPECEELAYKLAKENGMEIEFESGGRCGQMVYREVKKLVAYDIVDGAEPGTRVFRFFTRSTGSGAGWIDKFSIVGDGGSVVIDENEKLEQAIDAAEEAGFIQRLEFWR